MTAPYRMGHGFDVHRLQRGRKLILGGVEIPHPYGLVGHSDADVLLHALMNALLGAIGRGDIGMHFPDTDPRYKEISSAKLMKRVLRLVEETGFRMVNGDVTVVAQKPRLAPFYPQIRRRLARLMGISQDAMNIKAATTEQLGWLGKGQGMAAMAVVLLESRRKKQSS